MYNYIVNNLINVYYRTELSIDISIIYDVNKIQYFDK